MLKNKLFLLDKIQNTSDLKKLKLEELVQLSDQIRQFIIQNVAKTGGHLGAALGVVELTTALHYFFNSPKDKIIWDVGHQSYAHKILTGRKDRFNTLRQYKGISGFPKISENVHDAYGTGHASTSVSAGLGIAKARDLKKENYDIIAVIGDSSMTGGNALEAINQAGYLNTKIIVLLNDNRMSISKNVGALSSYTHRIETTDVYRQVKETMEELIKQGNGLRDKLLQLKSYLKNVGSPGLLFEKLGFKYIGPLDGHNIEKMLDAFQEAKKHNGPSLIHLRTVKGKGYTFAEEDKPKFHGVNPFNIENGNDLSCRNAPTYTDVFSDALVELAEKDDSIVAITAAMADGTGLIKFAERFPKRFFDVGIAEQHAVVFAAGLARQGLKPVCAIYSTFLQRAYDAIVHDVCLQQLPVIFAIDRAGIVGHDGPTHHGNFDLSYLRHIPNLVIMAPKDAQELRDMFYTALSLNKPVAIRYPRACCDKIKQKRFHRINIGKCQLAEKGDLIALVSIGTVFQETKQAQKILADRGIKTTLINARFVKPLDKLIARNINDTGRAIIIEDNSTQGGFGSAVLELCQKYNVNAKIKMIGIADKFIVQGSQNQLKKDCGLDSENIVKVAQALLEGTKTSSEQKLILVDQNDHIIGYENKNKCHKDDGLLHRAFSIFIFNDKKQLLIQKRSSKKALWPLYWSNSVCSHPVKGENIGRAATRRLNEELGIDTPLKKLFTFQYKAKYNNAFSENELCSVYIGKTNKNLKANHNEIKECKYINLPELNKDLNLNPDHYTPWFKLEWNIILKKHLNVVK
ncbi:MAG: 1-deoxy-D-xylulose-5-phosphate synthase [Actinomycetota bacterium]